MPDSRLISRRIIRDGAVVPDDWTLVTGDESLLPEGRVIVPLRTWLARRSFFLSRAGMPVGVWIDGHDDPATLAPDLAHLALLAIRFPKFADGRGYSTAALLRSRYGFRGELRAIGDVLRDQLFYLKRVGFNAFAVREDKDIDDALTALKDFSEPYQGSVDPPLPLYARRSRDPVDSRARSLALPEA